MANINIISLSGDAFIDVGEENISGLIVTNTDTEDVKFDLIIGPKSLHNTTSSNNAVFVLKQIPVPVGSTFVWDDDGILSNAFKAGNSISKYNNVSRRFEDTKDQTFLIRLGSGHIGDVILRRR